MRSCLGDEELFALVDGALPAKDAMLLREHVDGCARCADSVKTLERALSCLAEEPPLDVRAHADAVLAALDRPQPQARVRPWRRALPLAIGTLAAAAALVVGVGIGRHRTTGDDGFTPRGGALIDAPLGRSVAVTIQTLEGDLPRALVAGSKVTSETRFVASHRNTGTATAYALVFGVDARGDVHWLYPAFEAAGTDPASAPLPPTEGREALMGTGAWFDDLSPGRLSIVTILSREPLHVSRIEGRAALGLGVEALRREFANSEVTSIDVFVAGR
ncbi:MAG TPA: zf-HC2 domain-containing protein [Labilithrix sp.]|nr:zf-HC2 domain-containing protein [Labilithrix sp.]